VRISIDAALCQGHGRCYEIAPELVEDDDRSRGFVIRPDVPAELVQKARAAVNACPERAVSISE
jgi:ferredoxin